jgi:hypothetical protein
MPLQIFIELRRKHAQELWRSVLIIMFKNWLPRQGLIPVRAAE